MTGYLLNNRIRLILGIVITSLALWLQLGGGGFARAILERLDFLAYDIRLNQTLPAKHDASAVVIIDIDETSLRAEGRWPWSRRKMSELVLSLKQAGARTIGFDVAFTEPERNVARELIDAAANQGSLEYEDYLEQLVPAMDRDAEFASVLKGRNVVLGFLLHAREEEPAGKLPAPWAVAPKVDGRVFTVPDMASYTGNLTPLQRASRYGGFLNTTKGRDGVLRSTPLILRQGQLIYPSLSLAMARQQTGARRFKVETAAAGNSERVTGLRLGETFIPTDQYGRVLIPYFGGRGAISYIAATNVLNMNDPDQFPQLKGAAVIVGTSALGLSDLVSTPTDPTLPGVEVHATVLQAILSGRPFPRVPDWADAANLISIVVTGLLLTCIAPLLGALSISLVALILMIIWLGGNTWLWSTAGLALSPVLQIFTVLGIISVNVLYGYFFEARQKKQVRKAFSSYMAPALVDQLVNDPTGLKLKGESREMTFLFSDIAGFTSFTETATPEELVSALNEYLDVMCRCVMDHGGTIDKIVGDAVVGIFNAPLDQPDHASRAVDCALEMGRISEGFNERYAAIGKSFGHTRVGVNTGEAIVGNFGGSERFDYTAHGDPINTAARLESVNKHLGTLLCISGTTVAQCSGHFFRPVGGLVLKGKTEAIQAFEPISEDDSRSEQVLAYGEAFAVLAQEDAAAREMFAGLRQQYPDDPLVKLHFDRLEQGLLSPTIVLAEK
jgi:adenylate cyclase